MTEPTPDELANFLATIPGNTEPRGRGEPTTTSVYWDEKRRAIAITTARDRDGVKVQSVIYSRKNGDRLSKALTRIANIAERHGYT